MASFTAEIYSIVSTDPQPSLPISVFIIAMIVNHVLHSSGMSHILRLMKVLPEKSGLSPSDLSPVATYGAKAIVS